MKKALLILYLIFNLSLFGQQNEPKIILQGSVYDMVFCEFLDSYTISITDQNKKVQNLKIDSNRYFQIQLEKDNNYLLKAYSRFYLNGLKGISTEGIVNDSIIDIIIIVSSLADDLLCMKKPVLIYPNNSYSLDSINLVELDFTVEQMFANPTRTIKLKVHCNEIDYLSIKRAEYARDYIISKGVDKVRVDVVYNTESEYNNRIEILNTGYKYKIK